ncbi:MAG: hypothetical protein IPG54_13595 [Sphingomonadales bacterium]|nr:hypothetical protein [Sphingomonadales bacterium]
MIVFPAIDLKGGQVVRLAEGDMDRATVHADDPRRRRCSSPRLGRNICMSSISMAPCAGKPENAEAVEYIIENFPGYVQLGGGIRNRETVGAGWIWASRGL